MTTALVTRPREDSEGVSRELAARGLDVMVEPLLDIVPVAAAIDAEGVQGILATSANGVRALARALPRRDLPVWAVGDASARVARELGYARVESAGGDVETLAAMVRQRCDANAGALLHAAGSVTAGDLSGRLAEAGFAVRRVVLYEARTAEALSPELAAALRAGTVSLALFFSPRTAATFVRLVEAAGLTDTCATIAAYCLSTAVADRLAAFPWAAVRVAASPTQAALLAALEDDLAAGRFARHLPRTSMTETNPTPAAEDKPEPVPETPAAPPEAAPDTPPEPEPERKPEHGGGHTWIPVVIGLVLVALAAVAALVWSEQRRPEGEAAVAPSASTTPNAADPVAELRSELAATRERLHSLESKLAQQPQGGAELTPLEGRLGQTEAAVKALQAQPQVPAKLVDEVDSLGKQVAELKRTSADAAAVLRLADRVEKVESTVRDIQSRRSSASALMLAVGQLREALAKAMPYDAELRAVKALAGSDPEVAQQLDGLKARAVAGIPTFPVLAQRFGALAPAIVRAQVLPEDQSWWRQTLDRLTSLVVVRREDGSNAGTAPAAVVARAESALGQGDLSGAVAEIGTLTGGPATQAAPWLADARARLAADKAVSELTAHVVAAIGAGQ